MTEPEGRDTYLVATGYVWDIGVAEARADTDWLDASLLDVLAGRPTPVSELFQDLPLPPRIVQDAVAGLLRSARLLLETSEERVSVRPNESQSTWEPAYGQAEVHRVWQDLCTGEVVLFSSVRGFCTEPPGARREYLDIRGDAGPSIKEMEDARLLSVLDGLGPTRPCGGGRRVVSRERFSSPRRLYVKLGTSPLGRRVVVDPDFPPRLRRLWDLGSAPLAGQDVFPRRPDVALHTWAELVRQTSLAEASVPDAVERDRLRDALEHAAARVELLLQGLSVSLVDKEGARVRAKEAHRVCAIAKDEAAALAFLKSLGAPEGRGKARRKPPRRIVMVPPARRTSDEGPSGIRRADSQAEDAEALVLDDVVHFGRPFGAASQARGCFLAVECRSGVPDRVLDGLGRESRMPTHLTGLLDRSTTVAGALAGLAADVRRIHSSEDSPGGKDKGLALLQRLRHAMTEHELVAWCYVDVIAVEELVRSGRGVKLVAARSARSSLLATAPRREPDGPALAVWCAEARDTPVGSVWMKEDGPCEVVVVEDDEDDVVVFGFWPEKPRPNPLPFLAVRDTALGTAILERVHRARLPAT